jgi:8-oxo-dGTP pyrophosphatase MutT (NUDIX family)
VSRFTKVEETELAAGWRVSFSRARFRDQDGEEFERDIVRHPGAVAVVPLHDDGTVTLVRQFRAVLDRDLLELPAGIRDVVGEPEATTAGRELQEEAGLQAAHIEHLITFHNSPGFCDEEVLIFLATGLRPCADDRQGIEEEHMTIERIPLDGALALIEGGAITDAKTIIGLTLAARRRR